VISGYILLPASWRKPMEKLLRPVDMPEGKSGNWEITKFEVSEKEASFHNLRASFRDRRYILPGKYTRLTRNGTVVMSDTPSELDDHTDFVCQAKRDHMVLGHYHQRTILINGLGLGVALRAILDIQHVTHLTVIEKSADVIALVSPHWTSRYGNRLTIVHADALEWKPPRGIRYVAVWHDIWDNITSDNIPEMHRLHRKYGRRCYWQGSWCREECEEARRRWG